MLALEGQARRLGRTTLILDTRQGDPSEALYQGLGWTFAGAIPAYARSATGALDATAYYYKLLDSALLRGCRASQGAPSSTTAGSGATGASAGRRPSAA